jgi:hypothetical protein
MMREKPLRKFRRPTAKEHVRFIVENDLLSVSKQMRSQLEIASTQAERNNIFFEGLETSFYGAIHVRKGDYLNVASKVLGVREVPGTLESIKYTLPQVLIFLSDGKFEFAERRIIEETLAHNSTRRKILFYDESCQIVDETLIHDLMRSANFLMTINSTFSFSAGLLNCEPDSFVLFPTDFYGEAQSDISLLFRSRAKFGILPRRCYQL